MTEYEKLLDKMHFTIGSNLMDNNICRQEVGNIERLPESEILRSSRRTFVELKVMMLRLERALYGEQPHEETETEISNRNTSPSDDSENRQSSSHDPRVGDFSC